MIDTNLESEYYKKTANKEENLFSWQMRESLARKSSCLIWGNNYLFQTKNKDINKCFNKIEFINRLREKFEFIERLCSMYGRAIVTINKTKGNEFMINVAEPYYFNGVGKAFVQPQLAVIWQRIYIDNKHFLLESTYDCVKVKHRLFQKDNEKLLIFGKQAEILEKLQLEEEWVHNLGFPPIVELTNIPNVVQNFNNSSFIKLCDWFPGFQFEELAYRVKQDLKKELAYCHSRMSVENASQNLVQQLKKTTNIEDNDFIINTDVGSDVKAIPGNGDFLKYTQALNDTFDMYFKMAGMSRFSEGNKAQKTVAETASLRSNMIETVKSKISLRESQVYELLRKLFCCYGLIKDYWEFEESEEFNIRINGNILKDDSNWIDNQLKLINANIISPVELIQDIFNVSEEEAIAKYEINKQYEPVNSQTKLKESKPEDPAKKGELQW